MTGRLIPTHRIDERKSDGKRNTRFVAEGNRTIGGLHFGAVATSMPTQTAIKIAVSFAAGLCLGIFALDFSQACINAPYEKMDLYMDLPILPEEIRAGEFGSGKSSGLGGEVCHLKRLCTASATFRAFGSDFCSSSSRRTWEHVCSSRSVT
jgi:hypothetical protein